MSAKTAPHQRLATALGGISGVPVTPYALDGSPDPALLRHVIRSIASAGIHNLVAAGNTGEFYPLTIAEIEACHAHVAEAADGKSLVTAGVGRSCREAISMGRKAAAAGCNAAMVHHPLDPFAAPSAQADYIIEIAEALTIPVVAYIRSDAIGLKDMLRVARHPNVAGVKFASTNLMLLSECIRATQGEDVIWICGLAEGWAAPFYALGARGFTSGLVNVAPERSLGIWHALEAGDYAAARTQVDAIAGFEQMRARYGNGSNVTVVKEAMRLMGVPVGPVRAPGLQVLSPTEHAELAAIVQGWQRSRAA
jgi:4-hydroxy-tetrahydrodipicolinate synthase